MWVARWRAELLPGRGAARRAMEVLSAWSSSGGGSIAGRTGPCAPRLRSPPAGADEVTGGGLDVKLPGPWAPAVGTRHARIGRHARLFPVETLPLEEGPCHDGP